MASLYLHFPYCLYKCHYCDFNSYAFKEGEIPFESYKQALLAEWKKRLSFFDSSPVETLFFGGGTPSLMRAEDIEVLLREIQRTAVFADEREITLEANPKTIDGKKLSGFNKAGINRLSVGVQSLNDAYLAAFGRIHSADDAREALRLVEKGGFASWNADLIFGFPGQTLSEWKKDLREILAHDPPHLSCYSFTVEAGTVYGQKLKVQSIRQAQDKSPRFKVPSFAKASAGAQGSKYRLPDEDIQAEMFEVTGEILEKAGYRRYEISNFARPGHECRHNLNYWNYGEYVGLGAGAVSFLRNREKFPPPPFVKGGSFDSPPLKKGGQGGFGYRTTNFKEPGRYMEALLNNSPHPPLSLRGGERGSYWFDEEMISRETAMAEFFMMGLRLSDGISKETYERLFSVSAEQYHAAII